MIFERLISNIGMAKGGVMANIFDLPPLPLSDELVSVLAEGSNVCIERIISTGQVSDWYDNEKEEFVVLLQGNAVLEFEGGKKFTMSKGDTILIEAHKRHRVGYTSTEPPCIWLCVYY
jgi:cupin 2 domain-containing protein